MIQKNKPSRVKPRNGQPQNDEIVAAINQLTQAVVAASDCLGRIVAEGFALQAEVSELLSSCRTTEVEDLVNDYLERNCHEEGE